MKAHSSRPRLRARERSPNSRYTHSNDDIRFYRSRSRTRPSQRDGSESEYTSELPKPLDTLLPKNFPKPLTCFFWFNNGRCSKRDEDCMYAHWNTGHLAGAPITVPTDTGSGTCFYVE